MAVDAVAKQQFRQAMTHSNPTSAALLRGPHQIAGRFLIDGRDRHQGDLVKTQTLYQVQDIASIGLDAVPGRFLQFRRAATLHLILDFANAGHNPEADRSGLTDELRRAGRSASQDRCAQRTESVWSGLPRRWRCQ